MFKLDFKIINFPNKLIFITWRINKPISGINVDIKFDDLPNWNKNSERFAYCTLAD